MDGGPCIFKEKFLNASVKMNNRMESWAGWSIIGEMNRLLITSQVLPDVFRRKSALFLPMLN